MATRAEKKARTRNALMDSVLSIIGVGANFASISLREVAKTAGVVPTSFYRHFGDMEELGLAMVDELGLNLRRQMRGSFDAEESLVDMIDHSIDVYVKYVLENRNLFEFMNQSRTGGTPALQSAIRNELRFVGSRIATELSLVLPKMKSADREVVASLIVCVLMETTTEILALPEGSDSLLEELTDNVKSQMQVILAGASNWRTTRKKTQTKK